MKSIVSLRENIISEIKRLAKDAGGQPPGKQVFARQTGISEHQWSGVLWARWSDALAEAGYEPNVLQARFDTEELLAQVIDACRYYGHVPTVAEMKLYRLSHNTFPSKGAIASHFPNRDALLAALAHHANGDATLRDIAAIVASTAPANRRTDITTSRNADGHVYLLKSGNFYKVGRSNELERRVKEVGVNLPQPINLVHAIRTDEPPGIEAYWHRRFADRRANGEWFRLTSADVAAFRRRTYQ